MALPLILGLIGGGLSLLGFGSAASDYDASDPAIQPSVAGGLWYPSGVSGDAVTYNGVAARQVNGAWAWTTDLVVDADGAPNAYGPGNSGLDYTANAGKPGNWYGVVTDTGKKDGTPVVDGGFYISPTALTDKRYGRLDRRRYVNALTVPFLAIGPDVLKRLGGRLGDLVMMINRKTGARVGGPVGDIAPRGKMHEASVAAARALGFSGNPRGSGGANGGITYVLFPGSGRGWPNDGIASQAEAAFASWGGMARVAGV